MEGLAVRPVCREGWWRLEVILGRDVVMDATAGLVFCKLLVCRLVFSGIAAFGACMLPAITAVVEILLLKACFTSFCSGTSSCFDFLFMEEAKKLLEFLKSESDMEVTLEEKPVDVESDFAAALPEDVTEDQEQEDFAASKLKSAVHAFLDKNGKQEGDDANSLVIEKDNITGEIVSQKIHTIRSPDGSVRTIKTVEQLKNGVGSVKVLKIEEMLEVQDVDDEIFDDLQDDQKTLSEEHENSEETSILSEEEEESESEYRERTGQEP